MGEWEMKNRIMGALRKFWKLQDGMQTMEWLLLIGLIGTVLLGLMAWFGAHQDTVGSTIWDLVKSWIDKVKPS
jgi:Flp pilus assembly pilin Flp